VFGHAARGGIERELLEDLVAEGLSIRRIADSVGMSLATVRHWLRECGLRTARAATRQLSGRTRRDSRCAKARKCVLLCANCHAEVEGGVARLPFALNDAREESISG
jgi:hypothetical protein